jgi:glycosyltransferase involved in cell wall biosynthesis
VATNARVVYVLGTFPKPSETFILTEMDLLAQREVQPMVAALERGPDVEDERALRLLPEALFRPPRALCLLQSLLYGIGGDARARLHGAAGAWLAERLSPAGPIHVHAHFLGAPTCVGHAVARMLGVSFTFSCHASDVFTAGEPDPMEHAAVHDAHAIVACTDHLREHLVEKRGYPEEKVITIHHGVDLSRIPPLDPGKAQGEAIIGAVGRLVPKKGFDVLLRAAAPLVKDGAARIRIIGEGPEGPRLRELAEALEIQGSVEFMGRLPWSDTLDAMADFTVLAMPSVRTEEGDMDGIPNVILEAGALGVPVVASKLSGIPELVEEGKSGILVPSGDEKGLRRALRRSMGDANLRRELARELQRTIQRQWDAKGAAEEMARLFGEAVASGAGIALEGVEGAHA